MVRICVGISVAFLRSFSHAQHHCLVFERLHMNLYQALKAGHFRGFTLRLTAFIGFQLLRALHFLARPDIRLVHCDLKPENVMLVCGGRPIVRLVDFGSARPVRPDDMAYAQSRFYRAPEVILGVPFDTAVDVWSLGEWVDVFKYSNSVIDVLQDSNSVK